MQAPRELTKEKTLEIFDFQTEMQMQATPILENAQDDDLAAEYDYQDALFIDQIYLRFGIEKEDFQQAFEKYDLANETYVQQRTLDVQNAIPEELTNKIASKWLSSQ